MAASLLLLILAIGAISSLAVAHGGGLDAYGCHHNRKPGGYHCHRGPLASQVFMAKDAMLRELARRKSDAPKTPQRP